MCPGAVSTPNSNFAVVKDTPSDLDLQPYTYPVFLPSLLSIRGFNYNHTQEYSQQYVGMVQISMLNGFDYLEAAFNDLFGVWDPIGQSFSPGFSHPPDVESLYRHAGWVPRILNRAFETLPPFFTPDYNTVCPWSGVGVFWCAAHISCMLCCAYAPQKTESAVVV